MYRILNCIFASSVLSCSKVLYRGKGFGSYYYDTSGKECITKFAEVDGYTSCESYIPGKNQITLQQRNNNYIVAIDVEKLQEHGGRKKYCGKRVKVSRNGKLFDKKFVVWDGCVDCKKLKRLDFSLGALLQIDNNTCFLGIVPGLSWEITSDQIIEFHP